MTNRFTIIKILKLIGIPALLSLFIFIAGDYISTQRYYDDLLGKYLESMEKYLIEDKLFFNYIEQEHIKNEYVKTNDKDQEKVYQQKKAEYEQAKNFARSVTENTLRSLSKNDGICLFPTDFQLNIKPIQIIHTNSFRNLFCIFGTQKNQERRQLLLTFLQESKLGFKDLTGKRPDQPADSFLEGISFASIPQENILDLQSIKLDNAILRKAEFAKANLREASLISADLTEARLTEADLSDAFLIKANLNQATLNGTILKNTNLTRANLIDANLTNVELDNRTNFKGVVYGCSRNNEDTCFYKKIENEELKKKLEKQAIEVKPGLDLSDLPIKTRQVLDEVFTSSIDDKTSCASIHKDKTRCALYDTDLSEVNLTGAKLVNGDLRKTDFTSANLTGADLTDSNLTGANLKDAILTRANLKGSKGAAAAIKQAKLCKTILPNGKISGCQRNDS